LDYRQQLEQLWQYQQVDFQIDKMENVLRNSQLRQRYAKTVAYLKEQQANVARMEGQAQEIQSKLALVARECAASAAEYEAAEDDFGNMTREQLNAMRQKSNQWADTMARREKELSRLTEQLKTQVKQLEEMRAGIARAKKEYPVLKAKYEEEAAKLDEQTAPLRAQRDKMGEGIDAALLKKYKSIKGRRANPVARVIANQCQGCSMEIAQYVLSRAKNNGGIVECENCGRILYLED